VSTRDRSCPAEKTCAAEAAKCDPTKKDMAAFNKEAATITKAYAAAKIPKEQLEIMPVEYQQAGLALPGVTWTILAVINTPVSVYRFSQNLSLTMGQICR
jgi:hypothetical protein